MIIAYHGTSKNMEKPDKFFMKVFDFGPGLYFSTNPLGAVSYGPVVYKAEITLENPIVLDAQKDDKDLALKISKGAKIWDYIEMEQPDHYLLATIKFIAQAIQDGVFSGTAVQNYFKKLGFDGVYVSNNVVVSTNSGGRKDGDFICLFSPSQIISWEKMNGNEIQELSKQKFLSRESFSIRGYFL